GWICYKFNLINVVTVSASKKSNDFLASEVGLLPIDLDDYTVLTPKLYLVVLTVYRYTWCFFQNFQCCTTASDNTVCYVHNCPIDFLLYEWTLPGHSNF